MAETTPIRYRAFLSYSHRDKAWAEWLHRALESYRIDKDLVGRGTANCAVPKTLRPIFRDREDFSAGHSLTEKTLTALEAAEYLLVICSPNAAKSRYVNEEVRRFKAMGRAHRVIPVIIDGEPDNPTLECFPPALRFKVNIDGTVSDEREEPIAADARPHGDGKEVAKQKIVAALLGIELDKILQRAERARRRRNRFWATTTGIFVLLALTSTGSAVYAWQQLRTNERLLDATLKRATEIVRSAVDNAQSYHVPRAVTLEFLRRAEGLFDDMAQLGTPSAELSYRKAMMQIEFSRSYSTLGNIKAAQSRAESAIDLINSFTKSQPRNPGTQLALADAYLQLGHSLDIQGYLDAALVQFRVSLFVARQLAANDTQNFVPLAIISLSNERIGDILRKRGKYNEAAQYYRENLQVAERLTVRLPQAIEKMSVAVLDLGDLDAGLAQMRRALEFVGLQAAQSPKNQRFYLPIMASTHQNVGRLLLAQGKLAEALDQFRISIAITEQLANRDHSDKYLQYSEASARAWIDEVLVARGRGQEVLESYKERLPVLERFASNDPRNAYWQVGLAQAHELIADSHMAEGRYDAALSSYHASHVIWERVASVSQNNVAWTLSLLWSHSRLALLGDQTTKRLALAASTLRNLKIEGKLTPAQERWLPFAEQGVAAVAWENPSRQTDLIRIFWRAAPITQNRVRQYALLVALLRKLQQENKLSPEQTDWMRKAEQELGSLRRQHAEPGSGGVRPQR